MPHHHSCCLPRFKPEEKTGGAITGDRKGMPAITVSPTPLVTDAITGDRKGMPAITVSPTPLVAPTW